MEASLVARTPWPVALLLGGLWATVASACQALGMAHAQALPATEITAQASKERLPPECGHVGEPTVWSSVTHRLLPELSGLVDSQRNPGILWTHNDSGDAARVYALSQHGLRAVYELNGVKAEDFEDIARAQDKHGQAQIVVADTGDNLTRRRHVDLYRFTEPDVAEAPPPPSVGRLEAAHQRIRYPDGPTDVEGVLVDPRSGDVVLIGKGLSGSNDVFVVRRPAFSGGLATARRAARLHLGLVTAADISSDGGLIVLRTYTHAFLFRRGAKQSVAEAMKQTPCALQVSDEPQGESIAIRADGKAYLTVSEGRGQPIFLYPMP